MNVPVAAYSRVFNCYSSAEDVDHLQVSLFYAFPFNFLEVLVLSKAIKRAVRILWGKHFAISWSHIKNRRTY